MNSVGNILKRSRVCGYKLYNKQGLALSNPQGLICHKTQNQTLVFDDDDGDQKGRPSVKKKKKKKKTKAKENLPSNRFRRSHGSQSENKKEAKRKNTLILLDNWKAVEHEDDCDINCNWGTRKGDWKNGKSEDESRPSRQQHFWYRPEFWGNLRWQTPVKKTNKCRCEKLARSTRLQYGPAKLDNRLPRDLQDIRQCQNVHHRSHEKLESGIDRGRKKKKNQPTLGIACVCQLKDYWRTKIHYSGQKQHWKQRTTTRKQMEER